MEGYFKYIKNGEIIQEEKQLWGYVKEIDKYIFSYLTKGRDMVTYTLWFTSENNIEAIPISDISNPEDASYKFTGVFTSKDSLLITWIHNNKEIAVTTLTRTE